MVSYLDFNLVFQCDFIFTFIQTSNSHDDKETGSIAGEAKKRDLLS